MAEAQTVYLVRADWEHATVILGVYSTLEAAKERQRTFGDLEARIEHFQLDKDADA